MVTLEQVEKLREKANVNFEDAKAALEASNGDLLDALIYLEKQGKAGAPAGGGYYSSKSGAGEASQTPAVCPDSCGAGSSFKDFMRKAGRFVLRVFDIGNTNSLDVLRRGEIILSCPVTALVLLLIFFFWIVVPLIILSLFFGFRYRFSGKELGRDNVNRAMDGATDAAEDIKKNFTNR